MPTQFSFEEAATKPDSTFSFEEAAQESQPKAPDFFKTDSLPRDSMEVAGRNFYNAPEIVQQPKRPIKYANSQLQAEKDAIAKMGVSDVIEGSAKAFAEGTDITSKKIADFAKQFPSGKDVADRAEQLGVPHWYAAYNLHPMATAASSVDKVALGIASFITSPSGASQTAALAVPVVGEAQALKFAYDMIKGGAVSVKDAYNALKNKDWQAFSDSTVNALAGVLGGGMAAKGVLSPKAKIESEAHDASKIPIPKSVPESEIRPPVGEVAPLRQPGEVAKTGEEVKAAGSEQNLQPVQQGLTHGIDFLNIKDPHKVGVEKGLPLKPEDVPALRDEYVKANQEMQDAHDKGDGDAFKSAFGKSTFLAGAIEGAQKAGPNYDLFLKQKTESDLSKSDKTESDNPTIVGMGGAVPSEFNPNASRDVTGLAERVRKQREDAGKTDPTQAGAGIAPEASVERGRQLRVSGVNPETVMQDFEKTGRASSDDFAVVRSKAEELARATNESEEMHGTDSPEFREAYKIESDWAARTKKMQTEWAKSGHAQQGEVDIDTGTFSGLKRAYRESHDGEELPPEDEAKAKQLADQNRKLAEENASLLKQIADAIDREAAKIEPHVKLIADKLKGFFDTRASAAMQRIMARRSEGRLFTGIDPTALADYADYGASKILSKGIEGAEMTAEWAKEMADDLGDYIKPHLDQIWKASKEVFEKEFSKIAGTGEVAKRVRKSTRQPKEPTIENTKSALSEYKGGKMNGDQVRALWRYVKASYIDKGNSDFTDIVNKASTDLGLSFKEVADGLSQPKSVRKLTNELWRKQADARRVSESAKRWVRSVNSPLLGQIVPRFARMMFGVRTFGHGTVAFGTHAPMVAFTPKYWKSYFRDFGKMYKMVLSPARYEVEVQSLRASPNFDTAQRAGLVNDPYKVEDFNNPDMAQYFGRLSGAGNRGYFALKVLRQDMFDQGWGKLPELMKTPEFAKAMADDINHITGVVKTRAGGNTASLFLFAPRLLMSRASFLVGDPYKAAEIMSTAMTPARWKALPPEQKFIVLNQIKQKATILGVVYGLLKANQYALQAMGSKQQINTTDPTRSDFWKFKMAGMSVSYGNAMMNMARLPIRMWKIGAGDGGKLKYVVYPDESMYSVAGEFLRSQASPAASMGLDFVFKGDFQNRPLPQIPGYGKPIPIPKRLKEQGITPYTWTEYFAEQASPIPLQEAEKEIWRHGFKNTPEEEAALLKAAGTIVFMMGTGGRASEDLESKKK